ncbi:MAG TPA: type VI secretion system protein TssA [Marinobacter sp.]|nr:type VI secretion system protein TssA [Marinobacter sp.]
MQVIEQHPYVEQVLAPLAGDTGVGDVLGDDGSLEFLEDEIMKIGSLAHNDIDWEKVESEALKILSDRSKDLKVLGFLMLSLQRGGNGERFTLSLFLLHQVLAKWWVLAWPYPGEKGKRARRMMFTQMLQRAGKNVETLGFESSLGDGREYCLKLIDKLAIQAQDLELPDESLLDLKRAVGKLPVSNEVQPVTAAPKDSPPANQGKKQAASAPQASLGTLTLDPTNERATRQSLLKVADLLTSSEPASALGYQIRRYAIWQSITSVPPTRDGTRTDLAAVSADRVAEYREALDKTPDAELWQRIEQSLSVSPFWLDGHWLSAGVASALGHESCAEAIRDCLKDFVERLPQLAELTFNDGTAFLSRDSAEWLWSAASRGQPGVGSTNPWEQAYEKARDLVSQKELATAMQLMEDGLSEAREPRDRFYWRLANARLLRDAGLKSLATQQIQDLREQIRGLALDDWEPALIKQMERLI